MEKITVSEVPSLKSVLTAFGRNGEARKCYLKERQRFIRELRQNGLFLPSAMADNAPLEEIQRWASAQLDQPAVVARLQRWHDNKALWKEILLVLKRVHTLEDEAGHKRTRVHGGRESERMQLERAKAFLLNREHTLKGAHGFRTKLGALLNKQETVLAAE